MKRSKDIIKGDVVWYWYREQKKWCRGKVIAVNRYHLTIKNRITNKPYIAPSYQWCISASMPKPIKPAANSIHESWQRRGWEFVGQVLTKVRRSEEL